MLQETDNCVFAIQHGGLLYFFPFNQVWEMDQRGTPVNG